MSHWFRIVAFPDPQTLPRVIGIFAQRSLIPAAMSSHLRGEMLHIEARLDDLDPPIAAIVVAKLREVVLVADAEVDAATAATDPAGSTVSAARAAAGLR
ncbi:MAG: hypothetical protein JHD35_02290 [Sphingopyxis sp.]|nr:hypothetical protein [Sphingopyxis sp.]